MGWKKYTVRANTLPENEKILINHYRALSGEDVWKCAKCNFDSNGILFETCTNVKAKCTGRRPKDALSPKQKEYLQPFIEKYRYVNTEMSLPRLPLCQVGDKVTVFQIRSAEGIWTKVTKKFWKGQRIGEVKELFHDGKVKVLFQNKAETLFVEALSLKEAAAPTKK